MKDAKSSELNVWRDERGFLRVEGVKVILLWQDEHGRVCCDASEEAIELMRDWEDVQQAQADLEYWGETG